MVCKKISIFVLGLLVFSGIRTKASVEPARFFSTHFIIQHKMNQEIWKDVKGYEDIYQVSDLGRVKSLKFGKEKILKLITNTGGYLVVNLFKSGVKKTKGIHQLVGIAFLNHIPCGLKLVPNHKDFNKTNNRADNLEIITNRDNTNRKHIENTSKYVGVSWYKITGKWCSHIYINSKQICLGYFTNEYDAHLAYQNKLLILK